MTRLFKYLCVSATTSLKIAFTLHVSLKVSLRCVSLKIARKYTQNQKASRYNVSHNRDTTKFVIGFCFISSNFLWMQKKTTTLVGVAQTTRSALQDYNSENTHKQAFVRATFFLEL